MAYYGIAGFTGDFNKVRDDALMSGVNAKNAMRDSYLADYQMPEKMLASDANATANSIAYDTLNTGYNDMVRHGVNNASFNARLSGLNLDKLVADQSIQKLRAEAAQQGMTNPADISRYVFANLPPHQVAANPYLTNAALEQQRAAGQMQANLGGALGGTLGAGLTNQGLHDLGYGITASTDENGNVVYADASGNRSTPFARSGQIPSAVAFGGNVDPMVAYYGNLDSMAAQNARTNAQLGVQERIAIGRYGLGGTGGTGGADYRAKLGALQRMYTTQLSKGDKVGAAQTAQQIQGLLTQGGINGGHSGATSGMSAITGGAQAVSGSGMTGFEPNPFGYPDDTESSVPSLSRAAAAPPVSPVVPGTVTATPPAVPLTLRQLQAAAEAPQPVYLNAIRGARQLPVLSDAVQGMAAVPGGFTANDLALLKLLRGG